MHDWVKGLLSVRRSHPALMTGEEQVLHADQDVLVYVRGRALDDGCSADGGERVVVAVNKGDRTAEFVMPADHTALEHCGNQRILLGKGVSFDLEGEGIRLIIPAGASAVAAFN
jgi:hypothetical protein